ncbi:hypothetical protein BGZ82_005718 [Podila clonocystis]|nr:hypothetical protein BGZ82_005718 [Podila clonocystis]
MQVKAPSLLEKIFDDFFADSALHQQEEYLIKQQQQQQRELLSHNTYLLNQSITGSAELNDSAITLQRMNALYSHKSAEQARKQAKWDAVRMLGVLYALDKTHVGVTLQLYQCFGSQWGKRRGRSASGCVHNNPRRKYTCFA